MGVLALRLDGHFDEIRKRFDRLVQRYLDVLSETFMVRQLPSWRENLGKRQVKAQ